MLWIFLAFLAPVLFGLANILDNYFVNRLFKNVTSLVFYATLLNLLFLPFLFFIQTPHLPAWNLIPAFIAVALVDILYLFPYYKALQHDDTSTVSSLFSLGKVFVPLLAFLFVGEVLHPTQYLGFFILILSSALITMEPGKLKFNRSFMYMALSSLLIALETVIYKYIFTNVNWITGFTWALLFSFFLLLPLLMLKKTRASIRAQAHVFRKTFHLFALEELLTFGGFAAITYAISVASVTIVNAIGSFQPFFVLLYALIFSRLFPTVFKEKIDRISLLKKMVFFALMISGVILIFL